MSKEYQVIHKKSNVLTNGQPKLPSASTIEYGEIAINYAKGGETMSIKNANNEIVTFSSDAKILGQMPAVADYFDGAEYDSNSKRINFKHGNTVKAYVDATNFIKDGMVDDVTVTTPTSGSNSGVTCLVVTFNTDAGKEDIEIPLSLIFNPSDYYNKDDADEKFLTISAYTEDEEVVAAALNDLNDRIEQIYVPYYVSDLYNDLGFVDSSHTHSQYATTAHTHTAAEVGAMATSERSNYATTAHTHSDYATTAHTHTAAEVGAMATSERSNYSTTGHTHSQYSTTAHTHTASEVGAMSSAATLDNVADGATRKLSNYSTTAHTHSDYATTAHTHTASEVGAMATSERSNYATTAHTHTAADVGAMATSERSNYSTTGHTHSEYASSAHTHTAAEVGAMATSERSNYATTAHTHTAAEVGAMATSERSNYSTTGHTHNQYATTAHTHTAAEVGAMATSERSNYATTAHTHTAAEVGAMATSERSNYSTTGHTHSEYATTADTANFITSADTGVKFYDISASTIDATGIYDALPQNFRNLAISDIGSGITPVIRIHIDANTVVMPLSAYANGELLFVCSYYTQIYTFRLNGRGVPYYIGYWMPTEASISGSGFTKNAITGINVNGSAATITNGVAQITVQGGGGSGLPAVTAADNGKILQVVNGDWALVTPSTVYSGTDLPLSSIGVDGDIYLQTD